MPGTTDLPFANFSNKLGRIITGRNCSLLSDGRQRRHFGVEIEACDYNSHSYMDDETANDAIYELFSPFPGCEELSRVKDDCSLVGNHFEMVTSPMTMNLLRSLNWEDFFRVLRNADYKQTDFNEYDKAGIHVHVNRRSLHHPFEAAVNALAFITENEDTIRRFARRSQSQWNDWCSTPYRLYNDLDDYLTEIKNGDYSAFGWEYTSNIRVDDTRYQAVNFCSSTTWELRIFNSTLEAEDMRNILDFADALWMLADKDFYDMSIESMHNKLLELGNPFAANLMYEPPKDTHAPNDYSYREEDEYDEDDDW